MFWMFAHWILSQCVLVQVDQLSAEIHERKKKDKDKVDCETQTEEHVWTETGVLLSHAHEWNLLIVSLSLKTA